MKNKFYFLQISAGRSSGRRLRRRAAPWGYPPTCVGSCCGRRGISCSCRTGWYAEVGRRRLCRGTWLSPRKSSYRMGGDLTWLRFRGLLIDKLLDQRLFKFWSENFFFYIEIF